MKSSASPSRFSPKVLIVILLSAALILFCGLFLFRSVLSGNVLTTIDAAPFRFDLRGSGVLSEITVYKDGKKTATVKTTSAGNASDQYGVMVSDVDDDGAPDLLVRTHLEKSDEYYSAWLWNSATGTYRRCETFIDVPNIAENEDYNCIVSHLAEKRYAGEDNDTVYYEDAQTYRIFRIVDGTLTEFARYEFVYYTKNDIYAYRVFRFSERNGELSDYSEDEWMDPDEAEGFSLKEHMDEDMRTHRDDYIPDGDTGAQNS